MMPKRIQRKRTRGWKMPPNTVYVGRGSKWGNPYKIGDSWSVAKLDAEWCVRLYAADISKHEFSLGFTLKEVLQLRGKNLACWCSLDKPCHADVLLEIANA